MRCFSGELQPKMRWLSREIHPKIDVIALKNKMSELSNFTNDNPPQNYNHNFKILTKKYHQYRKK